MFAHALPLKKGETLRVAIPNEYIVKTSNLSLIQNAKSLGAGFYLVKSAQKVQAEVVMPNYAYFGNYLETAPNDPQFGEQVHHQILQTERVWNTTLGDETIIVAVTDNEFEMDHDDLKFQWWVNKGEVPNNGIDDDGNGYIDDVNGWDFMGQDNNMDVVDGPTHGTHELHQ
jgi:hypothetical protein